MVLSSAGSGALDLQERETPTALPGDVVVKVSACGVCRTDLHVVDGELPNVEIPIVPGHEIVGVVQQVGDSVQGFSVGDRVGIPWLGYSCGACPLCKSGRENLCENARFTGYQLDGGYADFAVADSRYAFKLPHSYSDKEVAPLLCAGLIGYRAYRMVGDAKRLGFYGFGAAAHIIARRWRGTTGVRCTRSRVPATSGRKGLREALARCGQAGPIKRRQNGLMRRSSLHPSDRSCPRR